MFLVSSFLRILHAKKSLKVVAFSWSDKKYRGWGFFETSCVSLMSKERISEVVLLLDQ